MVYFSSDEFKRCKPSCDITQMSIDFLNKLDAIREAAGIPMYLLSAYRSPEHDMLRGRSGRGFHTLGRAVDVSCSDGLGRAKIIRAALFHGCSVGVYPTFLHIDNRPNLIVFYGK